MKQIKNAFNSNTLVTEPEHSIVLSFFDRIFDDIFEHSDNELSHLKGTKYVYCLLSYGTLTKNSSIFDFLKPEALKAIKEDNAFFVYDAGNEGFSPFGWFPIFDVLYSDCKKYGINPRQIIYVTGNHKDPENIKNYGKEKGVKPFNVIPLNVFETSLGSKHHNHEILPAKKAYNGALRDCRKSYDGKFFSSLSRVNRPLRTLFQFMLSQRKISKRALMSHDKLDDAGIIALKQNSREIGIGDFAVTQWAEQLPFIVDYDDFRVNWATEFDYKHIHNQTLFQVVNETHAYNFEGTSLFYSEKTFKPIINFQPFLIWGQKGCNHELKKFGYKTYEDFFDLSFDLVDDDLKRCRLMLDSIERTCKYLETLSKEEQIEWRFKHKKLLMHNYKVATTSAYNIRQLYSFFKRFKM